MGGTMAQRIFFACLLVFLTGGAGTAARAADCSPVGLLQFYSAAARSNFSAIDGGDKGPGVLTGDSRARAVKAGALCANKVFLEDVPAKGQYRAYRVVEFDAATDSTAEDWDIEVIDQFMPVLTKQKFGAKPSVKRTDDGYSVTWEGPDDRSVVVSFYYTNAGGKAFSVRIYHDY